MGKGLFSYRIVHVGNILYINFDRDLLVFLPHIIAP